jgi:hypothetical protein
MLLTWFDGALLLRPESNEDKEQLIELSERLNRTPAETRHRIPAGEAALGSDRLFERAVTHHEGRPSGFSGESNHQKHVVCINKRH